MTIENLKNQLYSVFKAEKRLVVLQQELAVFKKDIHLLSKVVDKEYLDVTKLERIASMVLFNKILGDSGKKLEKEREEYLFAVLKYDDTSNKIKILEYEREILEKKIMLKEQIYTDLQKMILETMNGTTEKHPLAEALQNFETQIKNKEQLLLEIYEATAAAKELKNYLILVGKNLSAFDKVHENGLTLLFYDQIQQIKNIRQVVSIIDSLEQKLNKELEDILSGLKSKNLYTPYISFFENMHTAAVFGWVSNTHLRRSKECINENLDNTNRMMMHLDSLKQEASKQIESLVNEKRLYLDNV
ncbi:MAG: hypothetical protein IPK35_14030 [Saprospiraceae bacterium]|jgi:hypothetical protein|nr:hypothetical protein [Saprospiraceae bacterium]